ncbi:piggyBac transposable element-derived protein 4-like [Mytilus californianus]|uniref:piggyBac transposable element-derived protein 4-like n=1 Tax=Mytilus californianus TaxID=6549 RepID=UPI0022471CBA|nr:piggyBac transposable element-derived protein 4-like [Mytilus californianus]
MSRNRFQAIIQFLHCNNNETAVPHDQPGYDPLHKISPVIDILNQTFAENYRLNQDVCVDESSRVVGFKGRHQLKQYLSNKKAHKWGIKLWVLAESYTGYTHQIKVYKGRRNEARSENGGTK